MRHAVRCFLFIALAGCSADVAPAESTEALLSSTHLPNRADLPPILDRADLEIVASLPYPPANLAVAPSGRLFFSFMPQGNRGTVQVAELVNGTPVAYPSAAFQNELRTIQSVRVDRQNRLWILDYGSHGYYRPRIYAVHLATNQVSFSYTFPSGVGPWGSMFNDFQVSHDGKRIFIADSSIVGGKPGLVVLDLSGASPVSYRRLDRHASVSNASYDVYIDDEVVRAYGLRAWFGVDAIGLDPTGTWLYYATLNAGEMWRVRVADLTNRALTDATLGTRIERVAETTMTDGITIDEAGHLYLSDMEHSQIVRLHADGSLDVLARDEELLRWPDGFSWGPDRKLYVTASALHLYLGKLIVTDSGIAADAPYHILRIDAREACAAGERCFATPGH